MTKIDMSLKRGRGRLVFILIVALFVIPFVLASWFYNRTVQTEVWNTTNEGILIQPIQPLKDFELVGKSGSVIDIGSFRGHWTLVFVVPEPCGDRCLRNIYHMRQIWISLGREAYRLKRLLLLSDSKQQVALSDFLNDYSHTGVVVDAERVLIDQFNVIETGDGAAIMLVDPLANIMMAFPESTDPRDILKDIRKLMKVSQVG
jgi:cytochrome oxidase Cu insertion factor (SCO1/SenC/PrrC family)